MNLDYAKRWADALSTDTSALADLYADDGDFCVERHMMDDHMEDTISDRATLVERLGGLANSDRDNGIGIHTFTATEYIGDERYGLIHWDYTSEGASYYRGLPADGSVCRRRVPPSCSSPAMARSCSSRRASTTTRSSRSSGFRWQRRITGTPTSIRPPWRPAKAA